MYIYIYVYMYICIHVCIYICCYVYLYIYVYMYICIYVYMYICIFGYICIYICKYEAMYIGIHVHIYVYMLIFRFTSSFSCPRVRVRPQGVMSPCQSSLASMPGSLEESPTSRQNVAADPKVGPCQWAMEPARNGWKKLVYSRHLYIHHMGYIYIFFFNIPFFLYILYICFVYR